jgi:hypothetical protein
MYPENDDQYEDLKIVTVLNDTIVLENGWNYCIPKNSIQPKVESIARFYGKGFGYPTRGLFIDGHKIFYRTEAEEMQHQLIENYGKDCTELLYRFDNGQSIWSVEMGGLGPGYEQAIQITMIEILRHMLLTRYDKALWENEEQWALDYEKIQNFGFQNTKIKELGLSGAQWGAAINLACHFYHDGPVGVMTNPAIQDRKILVSKTFPQG